MVLHCSSNFLDTADNPKQTKDRKDDPNGPSDRADTVNRFMKSVDCHLDSTDDPNHREKCTDDHILQND